MSEHRKETRKKLMAFTPVYDARQSTLLGYIGDLTLQGAMVIGEKSVEINKELVLTIEFPADLPEVNAARVSIPARVAWCRHDESPQYLNIGFEFTRMTPQHTRILQAILERYQFHQISKPLT